MQKNQQAMATAVKRAIAKSKKIKELGISPDMSVEETDQLILRLAEGKKQEGKTFEQFVKGQEWYVKDLITFSALDAEERFEYEYAQAFPEVATEDEMTLAIAASM